MSQQLYDQEITKLRETKNNMEEEEIQKKAGYKLVENFMEEELAMEKYIIDFSITQIESIHPPNIRFKSQATASRVNAHAQNMRREGNTLNA